MSTAQESTNKEAFGRVLVASNSHDGDRIAKVIEEAFQPDVRIGTPLPIEATGVDAIKEVYATLNRAFPDLHIAVEDVIAEGDKVVSRHLVTGTHQGEYMGLPPTGRPVAYKEVFILRFEGGRIAETWGVVDGLTQMKQLGQLP